MGMYDIVTCKKPLPDAWKADELQTKDLSPNPYLEHYTIDEDGRLYKEPVRYDDGSKSDRLDMNWHGYVRMIGSEGDVNSDGYTFHEYAAKFTDGQLVEIKLAEDV